METSVQKTLVGAVRTLDQLQDLQSDLLLEITQGLSTEMHRLVEQAVKRERKALQAQPDRRVLKVPQVQKAQLVLKVQVDLHIPAKDMEGMEDHTVTNTAAVGTTMTVTVEKATEKARPITAALVTEAIVDMMVATARMPMNPRVDTTVMLDMEVTLTVVSKETDIRTAIKEMLVAMDILPAEVMEVKAAQEVAEAAMGAEGKAMLDSLEEVATTEEDTVIMATGAATNSPWKL